MHAASHLEAMVAAPISMPLLHVMIAASTLQVTMTTSSASNLAVVLRTKRLLSIPPHYLHVRTISRQLSTALSRFSVSANACAGR